MFTQLHVVHGCFHAPTVPSSSFNRHLHTILSFSSWPAKPKIFTTWNAIENICCPLYYIFICFFIIYIPYYIASTLRAGVWLFNTLSSAERTKKCKNTMDFGARPPGVESEFLLINCLNLGNLSDLSVAHL